MTASNDIYELIRSLTKAEKRHLKLRASFHDGEKGYLRLFELYEKQSRPDPDALAMAWKREGKGRSLPTTKKYLYDFILAGLEQYHAQSGIKARIQSLLKQVDLLFDKSLYAQCSKLLCKARKLAVEYQSPRFLLEIIVWELRITLSPKYRGELPRTPLDLLEEERALLEELQTINTARGYRFSVEAGHIPEDIEERLRALKEGSKAVVVCEVSRARATYYSRTGRRAMALEALENERSALEGAGSLLNDRVMQSKYLNCLSECITLYLEEGLPDAAEAQLQKLSPTRMAGKFQHSEHLRIKASAHFHLLNMKLMIRAAGTKELKAAASAAMAEISRVAPFVNARVLTEIRYFAAVSHCMAGDASSALKALAAIGTAEMEGCSDEFAMDIRWLQVIAHYEKGNLDAVEYLLGSLGRELKHRASAKPEHLLLHTLFQALNNAVTTADRQRAFLKCLEGMDAIREKRSPLAFDYSAWCARQV